MQVKGEMQRTSLCCLICFLFTLFWSLHFTVACKYLQAIQILETNALQKSTSPTYTPVQIGIAQDVSINLTQLFQTELSISVEEARHTLIFFTDASESRPFVIRQGKDGSRILTNELPIDREEICDPYKFPHHAAVSRRCCARKSSQQMKATAAAVAEDEDEEAEERVENHTENSLNPPRLDFRCCVFLGITVEGYGTFALRIDVVDVNDNPPRFHLSPDFTLGHGGKETPAVLKIVENTVQGTIISLPQAFDLDEGKNAELLFRVEKMSPMATWERHFKLLSGSEDRCITNTLTDIQLRDVTFPALCLLSTIDRETTPTAGFTFDLIARDQGEPVALSTTLSMSIVVLDENDNAPMFKQSEFKVFVKENEIGKTLVHLRVTDVDLGENARLSYFLRPGSHFVAHQKLPTDFLRMHVLASPAPDGVVLRLMQPLDYEMVSAFDFEVVVQDHGTPRLASTATVSVQVLNTNDQPPVIRFFNKGNLLNFDYASLEREEDTDIQSPKVICHVHVYDQDTSLDEVLCEITSPQRLFDLREVRSENTIQRRKVYELISLAPLDRERAPSYLVNVRCVDGRTATRLIGQSQIRILLKDANDNPPVFDKTQFFGTVVENEANAIVDFRDSFMHYGHTSRQFMSTSHIHANDADAGPNAAINYSLAPWRREEEDGETNSTVGEKEEEEEDYEYFHIDRITGQVKTRVALDYETKSSYYLLVIATDQPLNASQALSSTAKLIITVKDVDDNSPTMLQQNYSFEVTESAPSHTIVGRVEATDADSLPENRMINYQLRALSVPSMVAGDGSAAFVALDSVTTLSPLPPPPPLPPPLSPPPPPPPPPPPLPPPALPPIASLLAPSPPSAATAAAVLHFFTIDRHSGVIRTTRPLDREQLPQVMLEVVAHSGSLERFRGSNANSFSSTATVVINVVDKNDNAPYMVSLTSPDKKRVLLAEITIRPDELQGEPPICVAFPYAFNDDDDFMSGNGNVTVTLDSNPNFEFNADCTRLCLKMDKKRGVNRSITPPPPGRYSLNVLAQDNPKEIIHRLTKRFPVRVLIQSPMQDNTPPLGAPIRQEAVSLFKSSRAMGDPPPRHSGKSPATGRILGTLQRPSSATPNRGVNSNWEYRNVTVIAVLVCMACILCIILLAILLFMKKCAYMRNFIIKDPPRPDAQSCGLNAPTPVTLHDLSPKSGKFATVGRYPAFETDRYPCVDIKSQMVVTIPPGSEKSFTITPSGQIVGSVIYGDETTQMSPLLTQKNNLVIPVCHGGSLQKVSFGPIYGTACVSGSRPPTASITKSPICSISLGSQYASQTPVNTTTQSKSQTYSVLLPSKSYDELLHCSSIKPSPLNCQQHQSLLTAYNNVGKKHQEDYQSPSVQTITPDDRNSVSLNYNSNVSFTPLHLTPSSSQSPSGITDPCGCGQASFV